MLALMFTASSAFAESKPPFQPSYGQGVKISASTSASSATAITGGSQILIANEGAETIFVKFGGSGVAAIVDSEMPVLGSSYAVISRDSVSQTHVSVIKVSGSASNVWIIPGSGQ